MRSLKQYLRKIIYRIPGAQAFWIELIKRLGAEGKPDFSGWGMTTHTYTPWANGRANSLGRDFLEANSVLVKKVQAGEFRLSQFDSVQDKKRLLDGLRWRHYIVFWTARWAATVPASSAPNFVECGVCDGLTAYFALRAIPDRRDFKIFLYDAWEGMKSEYLLQAEQRLAGSYSHLSLEQTQRNLNSAIPTLAALEFFFEKMPPGGVILFDDYGWHGYAETRAVIDKFFAQKTGLHLPLPTGQSIYFKR